MPKRKPLCCRSCEYGERSSEGETLRRCRVHGHPDFRGLSWLCAEHIELLLSDGFPVDEHIDTCTAEA